MNPSNWNKMIRNIIISVTLCCGFIQAGCLGCSSGKEIPHLQPAVEVLKTDSMPDIQILSEIRVWDNQVYLTYESEGEYGQQHIKQYRYDSDARTLRYEKALFKKDNGTYQFFAPSLFEDDKGALYVYDKDIPSVYTVSADGMAHPTGKHLLTSSAKVPYALVQQVQQAFYKSPDKYLFIGRAPQGGTQALFLSRNFKDSVVIDEVSKIAYKEDNTSWIINFGKATYNPNKQTVAFAYQLYPAIQFIDIPNNKAFTAALPDVKPTDIITDGADIWEQNLVQFKDITSNGKYIYALYWGKTFAIARHERQSGKGASTIIRYDWDGHLIAIYDLDRCLDAIGISNDNSCLIGYDGKDLYLISL